MQNKMWSASRLRIIAAGVPAILAVTVVVLGMTVWAAAEEPPPSGDTRAISHAGNASDCAGAGLAGEALAEWSDEGKDTANVTFEGGEPERDQYLTILDVADGFTVSGIVIKGGDGYNVYVPGARGLPSDPPWRDLNAPLVGNGNVPQISHWFVCATKTPPTTTTTTTD